MPIFAKCVLFCVQRNRTSIIKIIYFCGLCIYKKNFPLGNVNIKKKNYWDGYETHKLYKIILILDEKTVCIFGPYGCWFFGIKEKSLEKRGQSEVTPV